MITPGARHEAQGKGIRNKAVNRDVQDIQDLRFNADATGNFHEIRSFGQESQKHRNKTFMVLPPFPLF
jgi:hypothetical protein